MCRARSACQDPCSHRSAAAEDAGAAADHQRFPVSGGAQPPAHRPGGRVNPEFTELRNLVRQYLNLAPAAARPEQAAPAPPDDPDGPFLWITGISAATGRELARFLTGVVHGDGRALIPRAELDKLRALAATVTPLSRTGAYLDCTVTYRGDTFRVIDPSPQPRALGEAAAPDRPARLSAVPDPL
ncbi:hypothetical protein [Allonocardiopsis opalescens]|uniref:hypothetical protein n=1 Tax=Allonocardiopsis opalescens TaxID=1144618 RepID=UPI000D059F31|nr:hypothetical protein [Allonocardiopsis opalescens]